MKKLLLLLFIPVFAFAQTKLNVNQIPATTTLVGATNSTVPTALAVSNAIPSVDPSALNLPALGTIITDGFTNLTNWSNVGSATISATGGQLSLAYTGSFSTANYIKYDTYGNSNIESYTESFDWYPGTISSTSYGITLGMESQGTFQKSTIRCAIRSETGRTGFIEFYGYSAGTLITGATQISDIGLGFSAGDHLVVTSKYIKNKWIVTLKNTTTGFANSSTLDIDISSGYTFLLPNAYKFTLGCSGSTSGSPQLIDNFLVYADDKKTADYLAGFDSKTKGFTVSNISQRWTEVLNQTSNVVVLTNAGPGNTIDDLNTTEILSLAPKNIIVNIGINNIQNFESVGTVETKFTTFINALIAGGYTVGTNLFICLLEPGPNYNLTFAATSVTLNNWINATYAASGIIDLYTSNYLNSTTPYNPKNTNDGIHPNNTGHQKNADIIFPRLGLPIKSKPVSNVFPILYNPNGNVMVGDQRGSAGFPRYQFSVSTPLMTNINATAQVNLGITGNDDGGYLASLGGSNASLFAGLLRRTVAGSPTYTPKSTQISGIEFSSGSVSIYAQTGVTAGTNITPTPAIYIQPQTAIAYPMIGIGAVSSPTAYLDVLGASFVHQVAGLRLRTSSGAYSPATFSGGEIWNTSSTLSGNNGTTAATTFRLDGADNITSPTDANYTVITPQTGFNQLFILPVITANRNFVLVSASTFSGKTIDITNRNTSGFNWVFTTATVKDQLGNTITNVPFGNFTLRSDGTNWIVMNFNNPMTTTGDIVYSSSGTPTRLAIGGANTLLHGGTTPSYSSVANADITNGTIDLTTKVTGVLPIANGGTGSATQNFVDISTTQSAIAGNKTFTGNVSFSNNPTLTTNTTGITYTYGGFAGFLQTSPLSASQTWFLPNLGGTVALTNQLPIHGNSTTTGTATTVVTVTIGSTQANNTYAVSITPRDLVTAVNYYISAQTTTTFDVTFVTGITGSISFDWVLNP